MRKTLFLVAILLLFVFVLNGNVYANSLGEENLESFLNEETKNALEEIGVPSVQSVQNFSVQGFIELIRGFFASKFFSPFQSLALSLSVIVLSSFLSAWQKESEGFCHMAGALSVCSVYLPYIISLISSVSSVAQSITWFLLCAVPVYVGLHLAAGSVVLGSSYGAISIFSANILAKFCTDVILPLLSVFLGLSVCAAFSHINIKEIANSVYGFIKAALIFFITAFSGIISVQAAVAGASDIAATKTLKFVAGTAIPVVGTAFADGVTAIRHSVGVLKSGAGAFGILAISLMMLPTLVELLLWLISCKCSCTVASIFSASKIVDLLKIIAVVLKTMIGILLSLSLISIIISAITLVGGA